MARTPELVPINLHDLLLLLNYRWAASHSRVGDLGVDPYEDLVSAVDVQSDIQVSPVQLADFIFHMKECIFEKIKPARLDLRRKNYNDIMRRLKKQNPDLFKELPTGEVVMVELEEKVWE